MASAEEASPAPVSPQNQHQKLSLDILFDTRMAQNQHGLRHGDYERYRHYCKRRLRRLRAGADFKQGKRRFEKKQLTPEACATQRHLLIALVDSERAWAFAMELKEASEEEPRKRHHMRQRFKKAVKAATLLEELCQQVADQRTAFEAEAYKCWLKANLSLELEKWEDALGNFVRARTIYTELAKVGSSEQQDVIRQRIADIEPSVRYCRYMLQQIGGGADDAELLEQMAAEATGAGLDLLKSKLDDSIGDTLRKQATKLDQVLYRGEAIPVREDKTRVAILAAREAENDVDKARRNSATVTFDDMMARYDKLFSEFDAALQVVQKDLAGGFAASARSQKSEKQNQQLALLYEYLQFSKLSKTVERNLILLEASERSIAAASGSDMDASSSAFFQTPPIREAKVEDLVRMFDTLITNMTDLIELRSLHEGQSDDAEFLKEATAKQMSFKAMRCFYLSMSHAKADKLREASGLLERAARLLVQAKSHLEMCTRPDADLAERLAAVEQRIRGFRSRMNASRFAAIVGAADATSISTTSEKWAGSGTIQENMQRFDLERARELKVAAFPPQFEALANKPVLFDLASTLIAYPSFDERLAKAEKPSTGGFWGFWRR